MPCISTIAPTKSQKFLDELIEVKNNLYSNGHFQIQFSIHSTNEDVRKKIIPYDIWSLKKIAEYGEKFFVVGDRKITLNFAAEKNNPLDIEKISSIFNPEKYIIKITPINPTESVKAHAIHSLITSKDDKQANALTKGLGKKGFETIMSIGELEENEIGSNCGQHALKFINGTFKIEQFQKFDEK